MNNEWLYTDKLRLRVIDLEYLGLPKEAFIDELTDLYLKETSMPLNAEIEVLSSSEVKALKDDTSGYNGTAIHFRSNERVSMDQIYIISQGSNDINDWYYNISSLFGGDQAYQANSARIFTAEAVKTFNPATPSLIIGLAHSLAHNNNATAQLIYSEFNRLYSVNGAQTNVYQLARTDREFRSVLIMTFPQILVDPNAIYTISPNELKDFAEKHYEGKSHDIYQVISKDDPIYALSGTRGFFTIGDVRLIDTNPERSGLRSMVDRIPDRAVAHFQLIAQQYAIAFRSGNTRQGIEAFTGLNIELFSDVTNIAGFLKVYFTSAAEIDAMIRNMNERLPPLYESLKKVTQTRELIWGAFLENNYINAKEKIILIRETAEIEQNIGKALDIIGKMNSRRNLSEYPKLPAQSRARWMPVTDLYYGLRLYFLTKKMRKSFDKMKVTLHPLFTEFVSSHNIPEMLDALERQ
ncbi:hypothetical protein E2R51_16570 [Jeotgalibacillus sp. S-D1]|uniref:DUF6792 domain-containing protein n=1 Tax=Jeotgalibacillus sp. S-D1 TaxID=2552189 RepID=UPI00105A1D70|nr:DUF6792 domain-containing protein [Jeotgalibacillus sp. S-D1]TDL30936.1 hypothetical protein E2R51_16570 [Jeotgalibacillus sp. S-D1]